MRDYSIDILRSIGIIAILVTHVLPSEVVWQFFDYNVCLIVFLSGVSYMMSSAKPNGGGYRSYVIKRAKRILLPTWIFLVIYYAAIIMYYLVRGNLSTFNVGGMLKTFSLQTGWYVWVMRVFLITALVAPFIKMMSEKSMKWTTIAVLMAILICYEFLHIDNNDSIGYYLSMTIPYIVIFTMGMIVNRFGRKEQFAMAILLMLIFAIEGIFVVRENGEFLCTNNYKNPPLLYFTSFGLGCSMLFWMLKDSIYKLAKKVKVDRIMAFIGSHTMWYYLLHIPVIMLAIHFPIGKIMQFVFTLVVTTAITYLFVQIIEKKIIPRIKSDVAKKNIKLIFLG